MVGTPEPAQFGGDGTEGLAKTEAAAGKLSGGDKAPAGNLRPATLTTIHLTGEFVGGNSIPGRGRGEK